MLIIFFYCAGEIYCQAERVQAGQKHRRTYPLRRNWPRRRPQAAVPPPEAGGKSRYRAKFRPKEPETLDFDVGLKI